MEVLVQHVIIERLSLSTPRVMLTRGLTPAVALPLIESFLTREIHN
jgi:hypothetical protein